MKPEVSICIVVYNHQDYIEDCLNSVLEQEVNFSYEIIVSDDASNDSTPDILRKFASLYPDRMRLYLHNENKGNIENYKFVHSKAEGRYVVHLDSDDLMLPGKLKKQYETISRNVGCVIVWHAMKLFRDERDNIGRTSSNIQTIINENGGKVDLGMYLRYGAIFVHSSMMYRKDAFPPPHFNGGDFLDWAVQVHILSHGYGLYIDEFLGKYRVASIGSITGNTKTKRVFQKKYLSAIRTFTKEYRQYKKDIFLFYAVTMVSLLRHKSRVFFYGLVMIPDVAAFTSLRVVFLHLKRAKRNAYEIWC